MSSISTSTGAISVGGLASGIDTNSLVEKLVSVEQQKVTAIQVKQANKQLALTNLGTLQGMLGTLSEKATAVSTKKSFNLFTANTTDPKVATITGSGDGVEGKIGVTVHQMAASWKVASASQESATDAMKLSGKLHISKSIAALKLGGSPDTVEVDVDAKDSLQAVADKINTTTGIGVTATVVNFGGEVRLMMSSTDSGCDSFTVSEDTGGTFLSGIGLVSSSTTREVSDFLLRDVSGEAATTSSTLGSLYCGVGKNNIAATDTLSLAWTKGPGAGNVTVNAATITGGAKSDLTQVTVAELATWLSAKTGASFELDSSGELVATDSSGLPFTFSMAMGQNSSGTLSLGDSHDCQSWANILQEGRQALYTMDGLPVSSSTNEDSETLSGATITLLGVSENPNKETTLSLSKDTAGIQKKVQDVLDSYNALQDYIKQETTSKVQSKKDSSGMAMNQVTPGSLSYDTAVEGLARRLRDMLTTPVGTLEGKTKFTSLASVGITTDKDTGHLAIDQTKFQKALASDFDGVSRLFANSGWTDNGNASVGGWTDNTQPGTYLVNPVIDEIDGSYANRSGDILFSNTGNSKGLGVTAPTSIGLPFHATFARGIGGIVAQYVKQVTGIDGALSGDRKNIQKQITDYGNQTSDEQRRVDAYRSSLVAQFSAMETSMQKLKGQNSSFLSQIGNS
jgi:flagellar hook-associated protein 2